MVTVGDLKNNMRILHTEARQMKFNGELDLDGIAKGNPQALLPIYNHLLTMYNPQFTEEVTNLLNDGLCMKSDVRFIESLYKILRDIFRYKAPMTKEQFFTMSSFAERKVIMCYEVMKLVKEHCRFLGPKHPTNPNIKVQSVVDTGRHPKKSVDAEVVSSDPLVENKHRKLVIGMQEKESWQTKLGYLRPRPAEEEDNKKTLKSSSGDHEDKRAPVEKTTVKAPKEKTDYPEQQNPKKSKRRPESSPRTTASNDTHANDWDPSEAVECILAKVRDLPNQLTSFMKAVEGRLQKIEHRLDHVESVTTSLSQADAMKSTPSELTKEIDTLRSRLMLLENRVTYWESKAAKPSDHLKMTHPAEDKRTELSAGAPLNFASLERGDDSFSRGLLHSFSPIRQQDGDMNQHSNDTISSVIDANRRLSSTPNNSSSCRQFTRTTGAVTDCSTGTVGDGDFTATLAATAAEPVDNGDVTLVAACENLDTSTQQQVERIKSMFKATQQLLPPGCAASKEMGQV